VWQNLANFLAQWWAPEQDYLPIGQGGNFEKLGMRYNWAHQGGFTGFIDAMHREDVQFFAKSTPTVTIVAISLTK